VRNRYSGRGKSLNIAGLIVLALILGYSWINKNPQVFKYILIGLGFLATLSLIIYNIYKKCHPIVTEKSDYIPQEEAAKEPNKYISKKLMTKSEELFYHNLTEIVGADFIIQPQVNLATVIKKESEGKYQNELYRNIDFGIFKKNHIDLLLLIELNDNSHNDPKRKQRDIKVKEICSEANIPLMTFWLSMPNTNEYISNRIKPFLTTEVSENKDMV